MRSRSGGNAREDEKTPTKAASSLHAYSPPNDVWDESPYAKLKTDNSMEMLLESTDEEKDEDKIQTTATRAVPGKATRQRRRRKRPNPKSAPRRKSSKTFLQRLYLKRIRPLIVKPVSKISSLFLAVVLWYSLGVISISTSKLLLLKSKLPPESNRYYQHVGGVAPLVLTLQQLLLGITFLRFLLSMRCLQSPGIQPLASLCGPDSSSKSSSSTTSPMGGSSLQTRRRWLASKDVSRYEQFLFYCQVEAKLRISHSFVTIIIFVSVYKR
jgi:hypothetical protein